MEQGNLNQFIEALLGSFHSTKLNKISMKLLLMADYSF